MRTMLSAWCSFFLVFVVHTSTDARAADTDFNSHDWSFFAVVQPGAGAEVAEILSESISSLKISTAKVTGEIVVFRDSVSAALLTEAVPEVFLSLSTLFQEKLARPDRGLGVSYFQNHQFPSQKLKNHHKNLIGELSSRPPGKTLVLSSSRPLADVVKTALSEAVIQTFDSNASLAAQLANSRDTRGHTRTIVLVIGSECSIGFEADSAGRLLTSMLAMNDDLPAIGPSRVASPSTLWLRQGGTKVFAYCETPEAASPDRTEQTSPADTSSAGSAAPGEKAPSGIAAGSSTPAASSRFPRHLSEPLGKRSFPAVPERQPPQRPDGARSEAFDVAVVEQKIDSLFAGSSCYERPPVKEGAACEEKLPPEYAGGFRRFSDCRCRDGRREFLACSTHVIECSGLNERAKRQCRVEAYHRGDESKCESCRGKSVAELCPEQSLCHPEVRRASGVPIRVIKPPCRR